MSEELKDKLDDLKDDAGQLFSAIKDAVADKADDLKSDAKGIFADIKEEAKGLFDEIKEEGSDAFNQAKNYVTEKYNEIKEEGLTDEIKAELKEDILDPAAKALKEAREKVSELLDKEEAAQEPIEVEVPETKDAE